MIGLSPLRTAHPKTFQRLLVRPFTHCYTRFSLAMRRSLGFGSAERNSIARLRLAFAPAPRHRRLTLLRSSNSPVHYAKGTPSGRNEPKLEQALRPLVGTRFQVLFHSPPGVLFTFPSRYWFTIGRQRILSLRRWSSRIPTGFLVSRGTWVPTPGSPCPFA